jgi:hypothetical protein
VAQDAEALETANITECVDVRYNQRADMRLSLLVGFGHTPYPTDYRTQAMIERDRERNEVAARGGGEGGGAGRG